MVLQGGAAVLVRSGYNKIKTKQEKNSLFIAGRMLCHWKTSVNLKSPISFHTQNY